jgi:3-deoxy-D-manno-octulosonate 8-phosphate phosphatase (KDO 8-P phosphatase)
MKSYKENLHSITTFVLDVDGVFTDGSVQLMNNDVVRTLNSRDGYAVQYASKMGYQILIVTGGNSDAVKVRLENLGATEVCLRSSNKVDVYNRLKEKYDFTDDQALYMGDDIPDYRVMQMVKVATCPQDAAVEIKSVAHYQSPINGGQGCVRDVIEQTLRVQGKWFKNEAFEW